MVLEDLFIFCNENSYEIVSCSLTAVSLIPAVFFLFDAVNKLDDFIRERDEFMPSSRKYEL